MGRLEGRTNSTALASCVRRDLFQTFGDLCLVPCGGAIQARGPKIILKARTAGQGRGLVAQPGVTIGLEKQSHLVFVPRRGVQRLAASEIF